MGAHSRVAWWDIKRWLAMHGRRVALAVVTTTLAGSGLAAHRYLADHDAGGDRAPQHQPLDIPAEGPTIPWPDHPALQPVSSPPVSSPRVTSAGGTPAPTPPATFVSPTQPWPGSNP